MRGIASAGADVEAKNRLEFLQGRCASSAADSSPAGGPPAPLPPAQPAAGTWGVQVAAVSSQASANSVLRQLKAMGADRHRGRRRAGNLYKVRVTGLPSREAADSAVAAIKAKLGGSPFVLAALGPAPPWPIRSIPRSCSSTARSRRGTRTRSCSSAWATSTRCSSTTPSAPPSCSSITLTSRGDGVPLAGVPVKAAAEYLRQLVGAGLRVAICEQVEDPKLAKGIVKREVIETITPGALLEDGWLAGGRNNYLVAVGGGRRGSGAAGQRRARRDRSLHR